MANDAVKYLSGKIVAHTIVFKQMEEPETLHIVAEDTTFILSAECGDDGFTIVSKRGVAHVMPQRYSLNQVEVQIEKIADSAGNFGYQLHMENPVSDVVVLDKIEHLGLVNITAVGTGIEDAVNVVEECGSQVILFGTEASCLTRRKGIGTQ